MRDLQVDKRPECSAKEEPIPDHLFNQLFTSHPLTLFKDKLIVIKKTPKQPTKNNDPFFIPYNQYLVQFVRPQVIFMGLISPEEVCVAFVCSIIATMGLRSESYISVRKRRLERFIMGKC